MELAITVSALTYSQHLFMAIPFKVFISRNSVQGFLSMCVTLHLHHCSRSLWWCHKTAKNTLLLFYSSGNCICEWNLLKVKMARKGWWPNVTDIFTLGMWAKCEGGLILRLKCQILFSAVCRTLRCLYRTGCDSVRLWYIHTCFTK